MVVIINSISKTFDDVDNVPHREYGLLLATSPITPTGAHNFYFDNRIKATDELYKAGKIDYIIASGGDYTKTQKIGCDEPAAIRDSLMARGIPAGRIILDYEGVRTVNSVVKAKEAYGVDSILIISQKEHNQRAIYLAEHYGLDAVGYNARPSHIRRNRIKNNIRECFARVKMFLDVWI
jgi:SanA protein